MAYTKTTWTNGTTALSADNMNHIETGIKDAHDAIAEINADVYTKEDVYSKDEVYAKTEVYPKSKLIIRKKQVAYSNNGIITDTITFDNSVDMSKLVVLSCEQSYGENNITVNAYYSSFEVNGNRSYPYWVALPSQRKLEIHAYCPSNKNYVTTRVAYMFAD